MTDILIKKYPNRRLYDTRASAYITLSEIKQMVIRNETVRVVDAKSCQVESWARANREGCVTC